MTTAPYPVPPIRHDVRADAAHYTKWTMPTPRPIIGIAVHNTEGSNSLAWLSTAPGSGVSVHTLTDRAGTLWELVAPDDIAWHAGKCIPPFSNTVLLGIELENLSHEGSTRQDYPAVQVQAAAYRVACWRFSWNIPTEKIVRHGDIATPPGRRCDPSYFDWPAFLAMVEEWVAFFVSLPEDEHDEWIK